MTSAVACGLDGPVVGEEICKPQLHKPLERLRFIAVHISSSSYCGNAVL